MGSIETYRGTVYQWEVDNVEHFTVAFYFARFEDATLAVLHEVGLDPAALRGTGHACATLQCRVSYLRELRVGDILHIRSGVIDAGGDALVLGHEVYDSGDGTLCTTLEQRVALVETGTRVPLPLPAARRDAARALGVEWPAAPEPVPAPPTRAGDDGFIDTARDAIKPWEADALGEAALPAYIHRFTAANAQVLAGFGMTPAYMRAERRGFSTFEFNLRFAGLLRAGDPARVRTALRHVGNSSMRLLHRLTNAATGEEVATLEQSGVHLDLDARRPTPLPEALRERAKAMVAAASS
jgi:acyl-CoA thioesterase FadM